MKSWRCRRDAYVSFFSAVVSASLTSPSPSVVSSCLVNECCNSNFSDYLLVPDKNSLDPARRLSNNIIVAPVRLRNSGPCEVA